MRSTAIVGVAVVSLGAGFVFGRLSATSPRGSADRPMASAVLATWKGGAFTAAELDAQLKLLNPAIRQRYRDESARLTLVETLARTSLLAYEGQLLGFQNKADVVGRLRDELASQVVKHHFEARLNVEPTAEEIQAFYASRPERFSAAAELRVARIVLKDRGAAAAMLAELTKKVATDYYAFSSAAQLKSEDASSRARGGELPAMAPEQLKEAIGAAGLEAVVKAERGTLVPEVVEGPGGFQLLRLLDSRPARTAPLEAVRETIAQELRGQKRDAAWKKFTADTEAAFDFNVDREAVRTFSVQ